MIKEILETIGTETLSKETKKWLDGWTWYKGWEYSYPSKEMIAELSNYRPSKPVTLYRGVSEDKLKGELSRELKSFTYQKGFADICANIGELADETEPAGKVVKREIQPEEILVDFTMLPVRYKDDYIDEVIVMENI